MVLISRSQATVAKGYPGVKIPLKQTLIACTEKRRQKESGEEDTLIQFGVQVSDDEMKVCVFSFFPIF